MLFGGSLRQRTPRRILLTKRPLTELLLLLLLKKRCKVAKCHNPLWISQASSRLGWSSRVVEKYFGCHLRAVAARLPKTDNLELARAICRVVASVQRHEVIFAAAAWTNLSAGRDWIWTEHAVHVWREFFRRTRSFWLCYQLHRQMWDNFIARVLMGQVDVACTSVYGIIWWGLLRAGLLLYVSHRRSLELDFKFAARCRLHQLFTLLDSRIAPIRSFVQNFVVLDN